MKTHPAASPPAARLSLCLRQLERLLAEGIRTVSGQQLAAALSSSPGVAVRPVDLAAQLEQAGFRIASPGPQRG
jgi:NADH/NAD ratio-sensing transcriptional regulator Rex